MGHGLEVWRLIHLEWKNKSHLVPTAQERKESEPAEKRPPSSDSIKSSYKTLPPIAAKSPTPARDLDRFVSGQLSKVRPQVLEDFLATLTKLDAGRERGLPPDTIAKVEMMLLNLNRMQ